MNGYEENKAKGSGWCALVYVKGRGQEGAAQITIVAGIEEMWQRRCSTSTRNGGSLTAPIDKGGEGKLRGGHGLL